MKKVDPGILAAQNRRKAEKDKRRKNYHDSQVQGTNNSSIVSKRSVEVIYNPTLEPSAEEWFKHFVPKGKRRSPAINRGYWIRMESIKQTVLRVQAEHNSKIKVVNLGCGFDPFPFKTLAESNQGLFEFFDFDYPELVAKKLAMIEEAPEILRVVGDVQNICEHEKNLGVIMSTPTYKLVGCDLKNTSLYKKQVDCLLNSDVPVIFIAEVSLAYMLPEHANEVIKISSSLPNAHVIVLEQIMPAGDSHFFAQKMLYHFDHLRSPLQCVETYSTKAKQRARFEAYFPRVEIIDLFESWNHLISSETRKLVASVEDFDEWEEFIVFCQHYVVIHATNSKATLFTEKTVVPGFTSIDTLAITKIDIPISIKFAACAASEMATYIHGGSFQARSDELFSIENTSLSRLAEDATKPSPRMCHTLTDLKNGNLLLIGGRTRPGAELSDVWAFVEKDQCWLHVGDFGMGISRHSAVNFSVGRVLVFGNGEFKLVTYENDVLEIVELKGANHIQRLSSCSLTYDPTTSTGFVVGGTLEETTPTINDDLFKFVIHGSEIFIESMFKSEHFARIGCLFKLDRNKLHILGGAGHTLYDQESTVIAFDLTEKTFHGMKIPDIVWKTYPVFIGSSFANNYILGGGAVCYSFGSCYNPAYLVG